MLFLSIHPEHAERILRGEKTVELRRTRPRTDPGTRIALYASSPTKAVVGYCRLGEVREGAPSTIWRAVGSQTSISRKQFDAYFEGTHRAIALHIEDPHLLAVPLGLDAIRELWHGFHPPQTFRYLDPTTAELLGLTHT